MLKTQDKILLLKTQDKILLLLKVTTEKEKPTLHTAAAVN